MQEIRSSNPRVVTGIFHQNNLEHELSQFETRLEDEVSQERLF